MTSRSLTIDRETARWAGLFSWAAASCGAFLSSALFMIQSVYMEREIGDGSSFAVRFLPWVITLCFLFAAGLAWWFSVWLRGYLAVSEGKIHNRCRRLFMTSMAYLGALWAAVSYYGEWRTVSWIGGVFGRGAVWSTVIVLGCGLYLMARVQYTAMIAQWRKQGAHIDAHVHQQYGKGAALVVVGIVFLSTLLPAQVLPWRLSDVNTVMGRLTEWIGPAFVPKTNPLRRFRDAISAGGDGLWRAVAGGDAGTGGGLPPWAQVALIVSVLVIVVRRLRHRQKRRETMQNVGGVPWGFRWLWDELKTMIARWFHRLGAFVTAKKGRTVRMVGGGEATSRIRLRRPRRLPSTVEAVYVFVLQRLARIGLARQRSETPYEFLRRWHSFSGDLRQDDGLARLTDLYIANRYAPDSMGEGVLDRARQAAAFTLRRARLLRLRFRRSPRTNGPDKGN